MPGPTSTIGAPVEHLDLATVINVSQAVSGEIILEKLIDTLMRTAIEHAGAERGLLILSRGADHLIAAEATTSGDAVAVQLRDEPADRGRAAESRSSSSSCARRRALFWTMPWPRTRLPRIPTSAQHHVRSILCLPLLNQAKLIGVLYLENNLAPRVFAPARIAVLKLLASQAAISLGKYPFVPRSRRTRSEDPAPGRRQHRRDLHLGFGRSDS